MKITEKSKYFAEKMNFSSYLTHFVTPAHLNALSVAPMVDHTDRHCRFLLRLIAPKATLYTEMIVAQAIIHGDANRLLAHAEQEHPLIAQLGGAEPKMLADAVQIVEDYAFDAINLNVGCPSKRVKSGGFGACLMERPHEVFNIVRDMKDATSLPVTVKCRIGTDRVAGYDWLYEFVSGLVQSGVDGLIVHARIADLSGVSTKYNLNVPPIQWDIVERLMCDFPDTPITLNGGLSDVDKVKQVEPWANRIMVGRLALSRPDLLSQIHDLLYDVSSKYDPFRVIAAYRDYVVTQMSEGTRLHTMTRHTLALFHGYAGAKKYRQHLSTCATRKDATIHVLDDALQCITPTSREAVPVQASEELVA